jgi:hypothetical protein
VRRQRAKVCRPDVRDDPPALRLNPQREKLRLSFVHLYRRGVTVRGQRAKVCRPDVRDDPPASRLNPQREKLNLHCAKLDLHPEKVDPHCEKLKLHREKVDPHCEKVDLQPEKVDLHAEKTDLHRVFCRRPNPNPPNCSAKPQLSSQIANFLAKCPDLGLECAPFSFSAQFSVLRRGFLKNFEAPF